jgi:hypothetical protein
VSIAAIPQEGHDYDRSASSSSVAEDVGSIIQDDVASEVLEAEEPPLAPPSEVKEMYVEGDGEGSVDAHQEEDDKEAIEPFELKEQ